MVLRPYGGPARVLVGFDGSDDSYRALEYAIEQARDREAELVLVHAVDDTVLNSAWGVVFDPEEIKLNAADVLAHGVDEAVAAGLDRHRIRTEVVLGNPAAALTRLSTSASLVVLGRRTSDPVDKPFVGSTTVGVVGSAHCPVIVVWAGHSRRTPSGRVGVAVDTSARGAVALEWLLQESQDRGDRVSVISICRAPQGRWFLGGQPTAEQQQSAIAVTQARMADMVSEITEDYPQVEVAVEVSYGNPLDELVARTDELDLLAVEVHASFPTYAVGGLIRGLLTHAHCPVAVIRPKDSHGS